MANRAIGIKRRKNLAWKKEDTSSTYVSKGSSSSNRGHYYTGDSTLKKTKGYDTLESGNKENRGRKKADAPRGKRKQKTKYEKTRRTTKRGSK